MTKEELVKPNDCNEGVWVGFLGRIKQDEACRCRGGESRKTQQPCQAGHMGLKVGRAKSPSFPAQQTTKAAQHKHCKLRQNHLKAPAEPPCPEPRELFWKPGG